MDKELKEEIEDILWRLKPYIDCGCNGKNEYFSDENLLEAIRNSYELLRKLLENGKED